MKNISGSFTEIDFRRAASTPGSATDRSTLSPPEGGRSHDLSQLLKAFRDPRISEDDLSGFEEAIIGMRG